MLSFTETNGDVLTPNNTDKTVIVCHQVNCFGVMGAGLALQIKQQLFPVYQNYLEACTGRQPEELLGKVSVCSMEKERGYSVANIFSQREHSCNGCLTQYDALSEAFLTLNQPYPGATIRIPYLMSCGLAGGDWNIVLGLIKESFKDCHVEIWKLPARR